MHQERLRAVFDSLVSKTHVTHALIQPDDYHNDIPTVGVQSIICSVAPLC